MLRTAKSLVKRVLPKPIKSKISNALTVRNAMKPIASRTCNICNYDGMFHCFGRPLRLDAECPECGSLERHRLFMLAMERGELIDGTIKDPSVLHFAPERIIEAFCRKKFAEYTTADLFAGADLKLNMEDIDLPDERFDVVIANHVLEHLDDKKAAREISRILKTGGVFLCQVPIIEGWDTTYENKDVQSEHARWVHYGQGDHVRYYGRDFRERISQGDLKLAREVTSEGNEVIKHGLRRGEKVFVFQKVV